MILELDVGNTRIKWRLLNAEARYRDSGICTAKDFSPIRRALRDDNVSSIYVSSVAGQEQNAVLTEHLTAEFAVKATFASVSSQACGLTCAYEQPEKLGVDRWVAMAAAFCSDKKSVCVVDCGTAVTIDFVDNDGRHTGGYILPGLEMIARSLLGSTASISSAYGRGVDENSLKAGKSTAEAVDHGKIMMLCAAIEKAVAENAQPGVNVYLTGGDAAVLLDYLPPLLNAVLWPDLVLDGLGVLFDYRK